MLADARAPAVLASVPLAVMMADAHPLAVLAGAPLAVMLADACAPAVLAGAPAAVLLADARAAQARWKGRQGQRAQWSAGVRRTGTPHTRQS